MNELSNLLLSFIFNLFMAVILVRFVYYPATRSKRYVLTFLAFNSVIFFVLHFMNSIDISLGVGFGLFAIFTILRYRTDPLPVREMTYLFIIAALPVMNAASLDASNWPQVIAANLAILMLMFVLEKGWGFKYDGSKRIIYEKIELIRPERMDELMADLKERTGLKIKQVSIGKINFLKDTVELTVIYEDQMRGNLNSVEQPRFMAYSSDDLDD
ncbi:MAG: DUF4956 domain-containing protein [Anaerolineaceae bacterium]|nr:DUF4956 domain-containing protein [Anaerolineaceae bacterium]